MKPEKPLTDIAICRLLNIPQMTFKEWKKKNKDDWRYVVYQFFKNMSEDEIRSILNRIGDVKENLEAHIKKNFPNYSELDSYFLGIIGQVMYNESEDFGSLYDRLTALQLDAALLYICQKQAEIEDKYINVYKRTSSPIVNDLRTEIIKYLQLK